ncbi:acyltransferase [Bradyrhizobium sp. WYCCWR 13023]|uniref:Acyltransferase n=1 Tax=Bradyrhizobium zhengyangense TaxID=2911009 RepID=A0A9X1RB84_9BRAD|nr:MULTISPECIES: acyltransferase [Bradyrhizobium]MCG2629599.1 acyltransferase [Bradyrhizobium zhengyangense]MCG2643931.1 acyltransferase [Bradyrhizobium zhengyangense]MCG2671120.1 acyltransferase [Bradyrhizobium zhengyangense]MDA9519521.1 acyltransferase [Bradyrhizobium sp. CCBAU 11434]
MMTMSTSATMGAETYAEPKTKTRNLSLDRARTFLTLVVLLHHAVIPYTYFGHTDPKFFFGFDMIVLATDSFFMAMFFFLSGLFAWSGIARKGAASYLEDRIRRLGIPFVVCAFTVIPIAYYAISLRNDPEIGFSQFWWTTITKGPWPSGPIWFLWVLFAFDLIACLLYRLRPNLLDPINRLSVRGRRRPAEFFAVMLAVSAAFYVPGLMYFGPSSWFEFGPFSVQHGRVLLYATYFFFGAGIGVANMDRGLLSAEGRMAKVSWEWLVLAIVPYCLLWVLIFIKREILGNPSPLPNWYEGIYALNVTVFSVAIMFLILAFFQRFRQSGSAMLLDPMQSAAFGMFLVHYPITLWLQYWLFDYNLPAVAKALTVFVLTVIFSWGVTAALRTIPGATRVL